MRKLALIILDGWGIGETKPNNAIHVARTPFFDNLWSNYPKTQLQAGSTFVGLPEGQIGGSEVGHLTIGAGRVIYQELPRIDRSLQSNSDASILDIENFKKFLHQASQQPAHLIGLVSTGGVHSHENHLLRLLEIMKKMNCKQPYIHFISDGRDTPPKSGLKSAQKLIKKVQELGFGAVATVTGRFYAMDRDKNFDRTSQAIDVLLSPQSDKHVLKSDSSSSVTENVLHAFEYNYDKGITDEFIEPTLVNNDFRGIKPGEPLFFFNFRSDRMKQIVSNLHEKLPTNQITTMTQYDKNYDFPVIFHKQIVSDTLGEVLSKLNLKQLRSAETEKFPHVTYFFNGGIEVVFDGEVRTMAQSNKVKHDLMPEMKAEEIYENVRRVVENESPEFVFVNFANPDMVGHTGNFDAVVKGVEKVDNELKKMVSFLSNQGYVCCITADHGNADIMYDLETKEPHTAHTLNPVPFIVYDPLNPHNRSLRLDQNQENGLNKIAGTVLDLMEIKKSKDFESLIV